MAFLQPAPLLPTSASPPLRKSSRRRCSLARRRLPAMQTPASPDNSAPPSPDDPYPAPEPDPEPPTDTALDVVDASTRAVPLEDLKCELYAALSPLNRGLAAPPDSRRQINGLIEQIERANPTLTPLDTPELLSGKWRLIYTNALDVLSLGLLAPVALVSQVFQNIYETEKDWDYDVENVVQLEPSVAPVANAFFGRTMATITVSARGERTSVSRLDITFMDSAFKPETFAGFDMPTGIPPLRVGLGRPVGYIETTFLDEDLRVARAPPGVAQKDNLFVLLRVQ